MKKVDIALDLLRYYTHDYYRQLATNQLDTQLEEKMSKVTESLHELNDPEISNKVDEIVHTAKLQHASHAQCVNVYVDGAARRGSEHKRDVSAIAVVIILDGEPYTAKAKSTGALTSTEAEYKAIIFALETLIECDLCQGNVKIHSDAEGVVFQINMIHRTKQDNILKLRDTAQRLIKQFKNIQIVHVPGKENFLCDSIANALLDIQQEAE